jgi:hypothetical protein
VLKISSASAIGSPEYASQRHTASPSPLKPHLAVFRYGHLRWQRISYTVLDDR